MKKFAKVLVLMTAALALSACTTQETTAELPEGLIAPNTTEFKEEGSVYKVVAENEYLKLAYCEGNGGFKVTNKEDGSEFETMTQSPVSNAEKSLFEIYYIDQQNNFSRMYSHSDSVARGQYQMAPIENGMKLTFTLGEVEQNVFCPPAISKERFEAIVSKIEKSFDQIRFKQSYFMPDLAKVSPEKKADLLKLYPKLETEPLYVLTQDNLPSSMQKEISRILEDTGYTEEDYALDMENAGELKASQNVAFHVAMYVTLQGDELSVEVPIGEIEEVNGGKMLSMTMLRNFGSPEFETQGNFLLPDGSGSTMNFYNGKETANPYKVAVYGSDKSVPVEEQIFTPEQAYLPVFAAQYEDKAMMGIIRDGEAFAEIHAAPGSQSSHAAAYPVFNVRQSAKAYLQGSTNAAEAFVLLQKQLYSGSMAVNYRFYDQSQSQVADLANDYSERLFGEQVEASQEAIYLEFIGAAYNKEGDFSLGGKSLETFTTVAQVRSILEDLQQEGVGPLVVRLVGFGEKGMDSVATKDFKLNKKLGSEKELRELIAWAKAQGITLYMDVNPQYVYDPGALDGFSKYKDTAYLISNEYGSSYPYWPNTLQLNKLEKPSYILNPVAVSRVIDENTKQIQELGEMGIALGEVGTSLNSDFQKKKPVDRQRAMKQLAEDLQKADEAVSILTNGANAATLPYVDHVLRVPINKPRFDMADQALPFVQMVLEGRMGYSDMPINLSSNSDEFVMQTLATGAGFTYVLTGESGKSLRKTTHSEYYSTQYETWKTDILEKDKLLKERTSKLEGRIMAYDVLVQDVYRISYENGGWILCNGSDVNYVFEGQVISPYTYVYGGENNGR
ncbi:MAG: DUF5696 domain-containing protein [Cellulosilyticaceae bacterium]